MEKRPKGMNFPAYYVEMDGVMYRVESRIVHTNFRDAQILLYDDSDPDNTIIGFKKYDK